MIAVYCPFHLIGERLNTKIADCEKNDSVFSHYYLVFGLYHGMDHKMDIWEYQTSQYFLDYFLCYEEDNWIQAAAPGAQKYLVGCLQDIFVSLLSFFQLNFYIVLWRKISLHVWASMDFCDLILYNQETNSHQNWRISPKVICDIYMCVSDNLDKFHVISNTNVISNKLQMRQIGQNLDISFSSSSVIIGQRQF